MLQCPNVLEYVCLSNDSDTNILRRSDILRQFTQAVKNMSTIGNVSITRLVQLRSVQEWCHQLSVLSFVLFTFGRLSDVVLHYDCRYVVL